MPTLRSQYRVRGRYQASQLCVEQLEGRHLLDGGGLFAHWTFDDVDVAGNAVLDSAGHVLGPFDGSKTNRGPATGIDGVIGQAAEFMGGPSNGDHPFVDLAPHAEKLGALGQGTVAAWVQPSTSGLNTDVLTIMAVSNGSAPSEEMRFWVSNGFPFGVGTLAYGVRNGTSNGTITSASSNLLDGQWHHVAITVAGDQTAQLFVDGQPDGASRSISFLTDLNASSASIGRNRDNTAGGGQWFFDGRIDDVGLWEQSLSAAKIQAMFDLAQQPTLNYSQSAASVLFQLFDDAFGSVSIGELNWNYVPTGLPGAEGNLVEEAGGSFAINLGGGAGVRTGVAPLVVVRTDPADGELLATAPSTIVVHFSENVSVASLDPADLRINGVSALGASVLDGDSVEFNVAGLSQSGVNSIHMATDAMTGQSVGGLLEYVGQFTIPTPPAIATLPATAVGANLATLHGEVLDTGGDPPTVEVYWGPTAGGMSPASWDNVIPLGTLAAGEFSSQISGLDATSTYFYRVSAGNLGGTTWAATTESFTTTEVPQLLITEFMASNDRTLDDEDGDSSDWIEIYNPNPFPIDLVGWYLTDRQSDLTRWQFPSHVIDPNEYLVVFASNKDRAVAAAELHTNFGLGAGGEYVALVQPDGITISSEFSLGGADYPRQFEDISYGLAQSETGVDEGAAKFFDQPTPGSRNAPGYDSVTDDRVAVSRAGGSFTADFSLELTTDDPTATIYFTLDGSRPTSDASIYVGPIPISGTSQVRARVIGDDAVPGPIRSESFVRLGSDVLDFSSPLPIILLENFDAGSVPNKRAANPPAGDGSGIFQVERQMNYMAIFEGADRATLNSTPTLTSRSGIRVRGASSANFNKQSYSLETWGELDDDADHSPFGLPSESDWILYGPSNEFDWSLIHNSFIFELSQQSGNYAPRFQFVELFLNTNGGNLSMADHQGLYIMMEKIKDDGDRVDIQNLSGDGTGGGWMLQSDRLEAVPLGATEHPPTFHTRGPNRIQQGPYGGSSGTDRGGDDVPTGYNTFLNFESPAGESINPKQIDTIVSWFDAFEDALYGPDFADPEIGYRAHIDTTSFIDHLLLNNLPKNRDGLQLSTFMYRADENDKLHLGPIWDFDRAYDSNSFGGGATGSLTWGQQFLWMPRLFDDPDFEQEYIDRYAELRGMVFSNENMLAVIDAQVAEITEEVALRDGNFNWSQDVQNMKNWLTQRVAALDALFVPAPQFDSAGGDVDPGFEIRITAAQGTVYYTTNGSDPRLPGGGISPTATQLGIGESTQFLSAGAAAVALVPDATFDTAIGSAWTGAPANEPFDDSAAAGWISGTTGVGYDENLDYQPLIGLNLIEEMNDINTSLYTRLEFEVDGAVPDLDFLTLRMQYDDGFIAYLNGVEIASVNAPANPAWNSTSTGEQPDSSAQVFQSFDVSDHLSDLRSGNNVLAIHGLNRNISSSDMLIRPELTGGVFLDSTITINRTSQVVARAFENGQWSGVERAIFVVDAPPPLRITEVHFNPAGPDDTEFIELQNIGPGPLEISGYSIELHNETFPLPERTLEAGEFVVLVTALSAFEATYLDVDSDIIFGPYGFGFNNGGERIQLLDDIGRTILDFEYDDADPWPQASDGAGASLEFIDPQGTSTDDYGRYNKWRSSTDFGGSPGAAGPAPTGVVINEVLAHTDLPATDSIELLNITVAAINIGGWFLSDSSDNLLKYMIPPATILAPGKTIVFDESHFNPTPLTPGPNDFGLSSSNGDDVWLVIPSGVNEPNGAAGVAQFVDDVHFGATFNGQTLGRLPNGSGRLSPLGRRTLGCENGHFLSSPVVISEINYNRPPSPGQIAAVPEITADDLEYIELHNASTSPIDLTDWQLGGGIEADFADGTILAAGEVALVISFDATLPSNADLLDVMQFGGQDIRIVGEYDGQLGDWGDLVQLFRPDTPPLDAPARVPMVLADEVLYDNQAWPTGFGTSIHRAAPVFFGNDPANWVSSNSPGIVPYDSLGATDFTGDNQFTATDADLILDHVNNQTQLAYLDQNNDQLVNESDVVELLNSVWSTVPGDTNLDRRVDSLDLNQVGIHWQEKSGCLTWSDGNFDGDNDVDVSDLNFVGVNWQRGVAAAAPRVPRAPLATPAKMVTTTDTAITLDSADEFDAPSLRRGSDRLTRREHRRFDTLVIPYQAQQNTDYVENVDKLLANWRL